MEYKSYYEEDGTTFHTQMNIYFSQARPDGDMSLHEVLKVTTDTAVEDYRQRGLSRETLKENGYAILVSRVSYRFHKWPRENQRVDFVTWEEKPLPVQLQRGYKIIAEDGTLLMSGRATWIVTDPNGHRIIPTKEFTMRPTPEGKAALDCDDPGRIIAPKDLEVWDTRTIKFSDLDTNGHTTNGRYPAFVEDALPEDLRSKHAKDFKLNFAKEAMLGETLTVYGKREGNTVYFVGKTPSSTSFESVLVY